MARGTTGLRWSRWMLTPALSLHWFTLLWQQMIFPSRNPGRSQACAAELLVHKHHVCGFRAEGVRVSPHLSKVEVRGGLFGAWTTKPT